jgi:hypothetical protein
MCAGRHLRSGAEHLLIKFVWFTACSRPMSLIRLRPRLVLVFVIVLFVVSAQIWRTHNYDQFGRMFKLSGVTSAGHIDRAVGSLPASSFNFTYPRPTWLDLPTLPNEPVRIRLGILSHPAEFARRKVLRETALLNIPKKEIHLDYMFFVGRMDENTEVDGAQLSPAQLLERVEKEQASYDDMKIMDVIEGRTRLGEKRWLILQWV